VLPSLVRTRGSRSIRPSAAGVMSPVRRASSSSPTFQRVLLTRRKLRSASPVSRAVSLSRPVSSANPLADPRPGLRFSRCYVRAPPRNPSPSPTQQEGRVKGPTVFTDGHGSGRVASTTWGYVRYSIADCAASHACPARAAPRTWPTFRCSSRVAMSGDDAAVWSAGHPVRAVQPWTVSVSVLRHWLHPCTGQRVQISGAGCLQMVGARVEPPAWAVGKSASYAVGQ
jgi:hypothetical protein